MWLNFEVAANCIVPVVLSVADFFYTWSAKRRMHIRGSMPAFSDKGRLCAVFTLRLSNGDYSACIAQEGRLRCSLLPSGIGLIVELGRVMDKGSFNSSTDSDVRYINEVVLEALPNDLTRMIYLASLRDCNSGVYLHPQLSTGGRTAEADRALRACHEGVFRLLLTTPLQVYVMQLEEYIRYARAERDTILKTWRSLRAYRATVPMGAPETSAELFCLNVEIALAVLEEEAGNRLRAQ